MLKKNKKKILKNKLLLLNSNFFSCNQLNTFIQNNNYISNIRRVKFFLKSIKSKKTNICFISGKKKSVHSFLKLNRSVTNSFLRFNYFPNLKSFGQ